MNELYRRECLYGQKQRRNKDDDDDFIVKPEVPEGEQEDKAPNDPYALSMPVFNFKLSPEE